MYHYSSESVEELSILSKILYNQSSTECSLRLSAGGVNPLATNILVVPCVMNEACYTNACSCASSHMSIMVDMPDLNEGASAITKQIN